MMSRREGAGARLLLAVGLLGLLVQTSQSQQLPPLPQPGQPPVGTSPDTLPLGEVDAAAAPIVERQPSIFYLPDASGKLQPVLNFPLADFQQLLSLRDAVIGNPSRPNYTLELVLSGNETATHATLAATATIKAAREGWIRVPLRMAGAALVEAPQYTGSGEFLLDFQASQKSSVPATDDGPRPSPDEGYVVWLRGEAGQTHRLEFSVLVPLARVGDETRLKLALPEAEPARLSFQTAVAEAQASVSSGALVVATQATDAGSLVEIAGLPPEFELSWRSPQTRAAQVPAVLQANGTVQVGIDGRTVTSEALLTVSSLGNSPFQSLDIRLPPGADLISGPRQDYTVVEAPAGDTDSLLSDVVQLKLPQPTPGPVEVRLVTQRAHSPAANESWLELAGFEVSGAARQVGFVTVQVVGDWQIVWGARRGVRQVETLPPELRRPEVLAGFEYLSQPASLLARVVPRETRLAVEPEYVVLVDADRIRLEARLRYTVRGAKAFAFDVEMPDWEIDEVGPATLVDLNGLVPEQRAPLSLPLLQPALGEVQLAVRAHRTIPADTKQLVIALPRPRANALGAATVHVLPADNVTLVERPEACTGLNRQPLPPPPDVPRRLQEPLTYRGEPGPLEFAAAFQIEPGSVRASVAGQVDLREDGARIEQTLNYQIAHEPVESLVVLVPRAVVDSPTFELSIEDERIKPTLLPADDAQPAELARLRIGLSEATIGSLTLRTQLSTQDDPLPSGTTVARSWPLVMPTDEVFSRCELKIATRPGLKAQPRFDEWSTPPTAPAARGEVLVASTTPVHELRLALSLEDRTPFGGTFVDRAWIQSWHGPREASYRAAYLLASSEESTTVQLPAGVPLSSCDVQVDGKRVAPTVLADGRLQIALPAKTDGRHCLEFDYRLPRGDEPPRLVAPQLAAGAWMRRLYWEVVLAPGKHLVQAPAALFGEFHWNWQGFGFGRQPALTTQQLEDWVGVEHRAAVPASAQRYLLSAQGLPSDATVATIERRTLLLVAAGTVLAIGLGLIYLPWLHHPAVLFVAGVLVAGLAAYVPEPAVLFAQAGLGGVLLAISAAILRRWTLRRQLPNFAPRPRGSSIIEIGSTARQRAAKAGLPSTTEPAPLPMVMQTSEQP